MFSHSGHDICRPPSIVGVRECKVIAVSCVSCCLGASVYGYWMMCEYRIVDLQDGKGATSGCM